MSAIALKCGHCGDEQSSAIVALGEICHACNCDGYRLAPALPGAPRDDNPESPEAMGLQQFAAAVFPNSRPMTPEESREYTACIAPLFTPIDDGDLRAQVASVKREGDEARRLTHCTFCGKHKDDVLVLIRSEEVARICNECVMLCVEIVAERRSDLSRRATGAQSATPLVNSNSATPPSLREEKP